MDTPLATFHCNTAATTNKKDNLKYSVKVTDTDKIKEVHIHTGKPNEKGDVVAELYKSETPSDEVIMDNITEGKIRSKDMKGSLQGKSTEDLVKKMERQKPM